METNYKVKHRRILMPLKLMLLLVAGCLFGLNTYAQQAQNMKVANKQQLTKALENPVGKIIEFDGSYNGNIALDMQSSWDAVKDAGGRDKSLDCLYGIIDNDTCFFDPADDPPWVHNLAVSRAIDISGCGCCPGNDDGTWSWNTTNPDNPEPPGSSLQFLDPLIEDTMHFKVDMPGVYTLRYSWGPPWNSYAQTEYRFFDQYSIDSLYGQDVCEELETWVHMQISSFYGDTNATISYQLWNPCTGLHILLTVPPLPDLDTLWYFDPDTKIITYDTLQIEDFQISVPYYGNWKFIVYITDGECADVSDTTDIVFAAPPMADAGEDAEICDDYCYVLFGYPGTWFDDECYWAPNYAYTWVQISGPTYLEFNDPTSLETEVCRREDTCSYGQYEVALQVQNGLCYDADTAVLNFYEQPTSDAGEDQSWCDEGCFTLMATPYSYCSPPIDDERYAYWQLVSTPDDCGDNLLPWDSTMSTTYVCIDPSMDCCPYGEYKFEWVEVNGTCIAKDTVSIFIYEQPIADAGPDSVTTCYYDGCFSVFGVPYEYCSEPIGERYHYWTLTGWPAGFDPQCSEWGERSPYYWVICPCGPCPWGEYELVLTESNDDICFDSDTIHFYLFQPPVADAGDDFEADCFATCFSLDAMPFSYCSDPAPEWGDRYGEWTKIGGPAMVEFDDANSPTATACIDTTADCPYGIYTFKWTEYNGDCMDMDTMAVTVFEGPTANAGDDAWYCIDGEFSWDLWHTFDAVPYEYCQGQGVDAYSYWSKCGGPGYVTWYENQDNPQAYVHVSCYGCYCFVYHEVNGNCESTDTVHVCWYEHPYLTGRDLQDSTCTELCYDLGNMGVEPYVYGECDNYNVQYWKQISGAGEATFDPDASDPDAEVCVDEYGCYTFQFIQYNGDTLCADTLEADLWFFQQPDADAGDDAEICGNCYMMSATPFSYVVNECHPAEDASHFWSVFSYMPPEQTCVDCGCYQGCIQISNIYDPNAEICICDNVGPDSPDGCESYGTYGFVWTEINGTCIDHDTVWITFDKIPDPLPLSGCVDDQYCSPYGGQINNPRGDVTGCGCIDCLMPEDTVITVCAGTCGYYHIFDTWEYNSECSGLWSPYNTCTGQFAIPGYTYEWSFTGPAGSYFDADPLWYDCSCDEWRGSFGPYICFGECCDTARLYLTITSPEGCTTTEEWKFYVQHRPDATISGPEIAEVGSIFEYSIPDPDNPCYLYIWEVQTCGEIVSGQGTGIIGVNWTDFNENGGWGLIYVEVYDTCTCCCNTDSLMVRVLPEGSLGDSTLAGHVYYDNNYMTPLNGVRLTLWNSGVPIFETYSFNDIEGGNGVGYYSFDGINGTTDFGLTADYTAPWYGANATDALAVELKVINPGGYSWDDVQMEAGDVNASSSLSATDALWIKQRAIAMVDHFPAGDWAFPSMHSTSGTYDVYTLNYGDVNRSNIPSSNKNMPAVALKTDGTINVVPGQVFDLPIRVADPISLGAITLNLGYNSSLLEVVEVNSMDGALSNVSPTNIAMAWSDVNPLLLNNNDAIVTLRLKALDQISSSDQLFTIDLGTEFAGPQANVLEDITLKTYGISTDPVPSDYFLSYNRPNPFSTSTMIEYSLPETGKVRLSVVDLLGQEIALLVSQTQSAGSYTVKFDAAGLNAGVYIYKITVQGETRDYVQTRRMVVSH